MARSARRPRPSFMSANRRPPSRRAPRAAEVPIDLVRDRIHGTAILVRQRFAKDRVQRGSGFLPLALGHQALHLFEAQPDEVAGALLLRILTDRGSPGEEDRP